MWAGPDGRISLLEEKDGVALRRHFKKKDELQTPWQGDH